MKKFLLIGLLSLCVVCFAACSTETRAKTKKIANTVQPQKELSYKETMEQIINTEVPEVKKYVDDIVAESDKLYSNYYIIKHLKMIT